MKNKYLYAIITFIIALIIALLLIFLSNNEEKQNITTLKVAEVTHSIFYTPFYVYKYATGFISALVIADKLENDKTFKDKYIEFLSSGSSDYPLELLLKLGIDISDEKVLNRAYDIFNEKVKLLKKYTSGE